MEVITKTKLYAFQPDGHGELSFFVASVSEEAAKRAVENYVEENKLSGFYTSGWGTDYYITTVVNAGHVVINDNS